MAMWMVNFWIHFGEKKTQRRSRKIGGKWKVKEIGGDTFPPSVPSPTWIGTRAVRQSRGAGRTIPQSGGFEKYLTIIHGGRGVVHESAQYRCDEIPRSHPLPVSVSAFQILAGVTRS